MAGPGTRELVRSRTDIVELVGAYVTLRRQGKRYVGLCPFHREKTPSFTVDRERGLFHCFGCGAGGDVFEFVMRLQGLSFQEALRELARRAGVDLQDREVRQGEWERLLRALDAATQFYERVLEHPEAGRAGRAYLLRRGVDEATRRRFRLGYAPEGWDRLLNYLREQGYEGAFLERLGLVNPRHDGGWYDAFRGRLVFPICDLQGRPVAFGGRAVREEDHPKYLNSRENPLFQKGATLYGLHLAREAVRTTGRVLVVEGYMDVLTCHQYGIFEAVATLGTSLTQDQVALLRRFAKTVVLVYDSDEAGRKAAQRAVALFEEAGMEAFAAILPEGHDPDRFLRQNGPEAFQRLVEGALPLLRFVLEHTLRRYPSTPEGKARVVDELLPLVASVRHDVARSEHIAQLSQRLGVPEDAVRARLQALRRRGGRASPDTDPVQVAARFKDAQQLAEWYLLQRMLDEEEARAWAAVNLQEEDFANPHHREIFTGLRWTGDVHALREALSEGARAVLNQLLFGPRPPVPDVEGWVARIRSEQRRRRQAELVAEIAAAERAGDLERVRAIQEELKALVE